MLKIQWSRTSVVANSLGVMIDQNKKEHRNCHLRSKNCQLSEWLLENSPGQQQALAAINFGATASKACTVINTYDCPVLEHTPEIHLVWAISEIPLRVIINTPYLGIQETLEPLHLSGERRRHLSGASKLFWLLDGKNQGVPEWPVLIVIPFKKEDNLPRF